MIYVVFTNLAGDNMLLGNMRYHTPFGSNVTLCEGISESRHVDETSVNTHVSEYEIMVHTNLGAVRLCWIHVAIVFVESMVLHL